jgi:dTDP-4-amino-4,6-dideoxygalactose transaminase
MDALMDLARRHRLHVIEDAAHAIESSVGGRKVGSIGDFTAFSFYATKNLTTAEGGMLTANDGELAERARILSLHGISRDAWKRYAQDGPLHWETVSPGYKYNMFDVQAALGLTQIERLEEWWTARAAYTRRYREGLASLSEIEILGEEAGIRHAYHLLVILLRTERLGGPERIMADLRARSIGGRPLQPCTAPYYRAAFPAARRVSRGGIGLRAALSLLSPDDAA